KAALPACHFAEPGSGSGKSRSVTLRSPTNTAAFTLSLPCQNVYRDICPYLRNNYPSPYDPLSSGGRGNPMSTDPPIPADYAAVMVDKLQRYAGNHAEAVPVPEGFHTLIIGAGMSGVAAAIRFRQAGVPYTIIEKQDQVGG